MSASAASRPPEGSLAYYRLVWLGNPAEEPAFFWYEVDHAGCVLRLVEIFADGSAKADDITRYPDRASDFGFGTLIGDDFYALEWEWPAPEETDPTVMLNATAFEFECIWKGATA